MPVLFSDNFDSESEGTSPPINWVKDTVEVPANCEVDDAQAHSSPHSMYLKKGVSGGGTCHHDESGGFDADKITVWLYFPTVNQTRLIITQSTTGDLDSTKELVYLEFSASGDIRYYDGDWNDTGYDYTTGWHKIEIVHDCDNDQFDAWYDDIQIVNNGGFRNSGAGVKSLHFRITTGSTDWWIDDVQIGEASGWSGKVLGVSNPAKIQGVSKDNIVKVDGVSSS